MFEGCPSLASGWSMCRLTRAERSDLQHISSQSGGSDTWIRKWMDSFFLLFLLDTSLRQLLEGLLWFGSTNLNLPLCSNRAEEMNNSQLTELEDDIQQQLARTEERVRHEASVAPAGFRVDGNIIFIEILIEYIQAEDWLLYKQPNWINNTVKLTKIMYIFSWSQTFYTFFLGSCELPVYL